MKEQLAFIKILASSKLEHTLFIWGMKNKRILL